MNFDSSLGWPFFRVTKLVSRLARSQSWLCPLNDFANIKKNFGSCSVHQLQSAPWNLCETERKLQKMLLHVCLPLSIRKLMHLQCLHCILHKRDLNLNEWYQKPSVCEASSPYTTLVFNSWFFLLHPRIKFASVLQVPFIDIHLRWHFSLVFTTNLANYLLDFLLHFFVSYWIYEGVDAAVTESQHQSCTDKRRWNRIWRKKLPDRRQRIQWPAGAEWANQQQNCF